MATVDTSTLDVPAYTTYSDLDPTKQQENLAYINEQLWDFMKLAGFVLSDGQMDSAEQDAFQSLWNAQNDLIQQQSDYCDEVKATFEANRELLPDNPDAFIADLLWEFGEWIVGRIVTFFFGPFWGEAAEIGVYLLGALIRTLDTLYTEGGELCDKIKAENNALLNLPFSKENYQIRSQVISQHDGTLQTLLTHVLALEGQLQQGTIPQPAQIPGESGGTVSEELIQAVKDLQYNDEIIDFGAARLHLKGKVIEY